MTFIQPKDRSTRHGCNHQGLNKDNAVIFYDSNHLGVKYAREQTILQNYNGGTDPILETFIAAKLKLIMNLNWSVGDNRPYATVKVDYQNKLRLYFDTYADATEVAVMENEPTNQTYFGTRVNDPHNYLTPLGWAVEVCKEYGVKVADGSVHLQNFTVNGNNVNVPSNNINVLLDGYTALDLDFVNFHFYSTLNGQTNVSGYIKKVVDYLRNRTGHEIMCGEHSQHDQYNDHTVTAFVVNELKKARVYYDIAYSGDGGSTALSFATGTGGSNPALSTIGQAYADAIKLFPQ